MRRTDEADRHINARPARVFSALSSAESIVRWMPPEGMSGRVEHFDPRPGGTYRIILTYLDATGAPGKTSAGEDIAEGRFVDVVDGVRLVHEIEFESADPRFAGVMRMTWELVPSGEGVRVVFRAEDVPDGISSEDHIQGLTSSLRNLAELVERGGGANTT